MLARTYYLDLSDGRFHPRGTSAAELSALFAAVERASSRDRILVHFHGGLVGRDSAEKAATGLMPAYEKGGAYPVFLFWRSDLRTVLTANLSQVAQEPAFRRLLKRLIQLGLAKLTAPAGGRAGEMAPLVSEDALPDDPEGLADYASRQEPPAAAVRGVELSDANADAAQAELEADEVIQEESAAIAAARAAPGAAGARSGVSPVAPRSTRMSKDVVDQLVGEQGASGGRVAGITFVTLAIRGAAALRRVVQRFGRGRDHGVYTTVVEELLRELYVDDIGAGIWSLMKEDTQDAFGGDAATHGGTALLEQLGAWWRPGRRVTLVGHSTGAIYIGNFLAAADRVLDPAVKFDVVFLAPACTFAFLAEKLPLFRKRVGRLRLLALTDEVERGYWEVPGLYRGSLLYMVSGLFEHPVVDMPLVGMQRYFSEASPYEDPQIAEVMAYLKGNIIWSPSAATLGWRSSALKHGAFDDDTDVLESLSVFVAGGA